MKAIEQYLPVVLCIMLCRVVLTLESVGEILKCDHSNESQLAVNHAHARIPAFVNMVIILLYYSTITSFYHIRTRERAKYESVLPCIKLIAL